MISYENTVAPSKPKRDKGLYLTFYILKIFCIILTSILGILAFIVDNYMWIPTVISLLFVVVCFFMQYQFYNFYDLSFYEGEIKVVKVRNNKKRLLLARFSIKKITKIGIISNTKINFKDYKRIGATNKLKSNTIFIIFNDTEEKLLLLPFDEGFLSALIKHGGISKFEKELIEYIKTK